MKIVPCDYLPKEYMGIPIYLVQMSAIECKVLISDTGEIKQCNFIGVTYKNEHEKLESVHVLIYQINKTKNSGLTTDEEAIENSVKDSINTHINLGIPGSASCYVFRRKECINICAVCVVPNKEITDFFYSVNVPLKSARRIYPYRYRLERA